MMRLLVGLLLLLLLLKIKNKTTDKTKHERIEISNRSQLNWIEQEEEEKVD